MQSWLSVIIQTNCKEQMYRPHRLVTFPVKTLFRLDSVLDQVFACLQDPFVIGLSSFIIKENGWLSVIH